MAIEDLPRQDMRDALAYVRCVLTQDMDGVEPSTPTPTTLRSRSAWQPWSGSGSGPTAIPN